MSDNSNEPPAALGPDLKKTKLEIFNVPVGRETKTPEELAAAYADAVKSHPFFDNAHTTVDLYDSATMRDGNGHLIGVVLRKALPPHITEMAAKLLLPAAVRTSLRSTMFGGESPLSGIAGYFDYRGSPVELKARKTSFTYEHEKEWPAVFPLVDYVSEIYKSVAPEQWKAQNDAIPDIVRLHGTPYSTLTINSRFRTASHTDAGDFDAGYSCIACIDGHFKGLELTFDDFHLSVVLQPGDVMVFDSHHFHSNTEVETTSLTEEWTRLSCVFYYRTALGEPSSYAEYRRRLAAVKQRADAAHPLVESIVVKANGENFNRPSPVHPVTLSPFAVISALHRLRACAAQANCVHTAMVEVASALPRLFFGEELTCADGLPLRGPDEKSKANADATARHATNTGGFSETDATLHNAEQKKKYLSHECLAHFLSPDLLEMWVQSRAKWLGLVKEDWTVLTARNPTRTDFSWKNQSEMNSAFFDLCEVGKQVMLGLLDRETATAAEGQTFWSMFAMHLHTACSEEARMPAEAMSLRKLNVKLKDFHFGGTRYFKDMPAEEQQRRVERKRRIEEARRRSATSTANEPRPNWLTNDDFDYQSEDCAVDYKGHQWALPAAHAAEVTRQAHEHAVPKEEGTAVRVLVVLPHAHSAKKEETMLKVEVTETMAASAEWVRLMSSPAVHRILNGEQRNLTLPSEYVKGRVVVHFAYHDALPTDCFDFVVLQHVLSLMLDDAAAADYVTAVSARCSGCVLVAETDLQCRQYFTLKAPLRVDYDAVAPAFFHQLHDVCYGTHEARVRTKAEVESLFPLTCCARYKLHGSPLNTVVHLLAVE